jgi:hemerythrin-like domain-containing protein
MKTKTKTRTRKTTTKSATRSSHRATPRPARRRVHRTLAAGGDAIGVLKSDHVRIKAALTALADARTATRRASLIAEVERLLKQHTNAEEELFYPAFREAAKTKEDLKRFHEAREEHHIVDLVLPEVRDARHEAEVFAARAKVLKELVEHHIEEEHDDLFPRARRLLSSAELHALGTQLQAALSKRAETPVSGALHSVGAMIGLVP